MGVDFSRGIKTIFEKHLSQLITWFEKYFQHDNINTFAWIQNPFNATVPSELTAAEDENVIELYCDNMFNIKFNTIELTEFWMPVKDEYPILSSKAQIILIPFATSYLCEAEFSAVAVIKCKYRAKINVEKEIRVPVSSFIPRFEKIFNCFIYLLLLYCNLLKILKESN
jgi:hypothetical protein